MALDRETGKKKEGEEEKYVHYIKPSKKDPKFPDGYRFILVDTIEYLKQILEEQNEQGDIAFDLETTGLNFEDDFIVGVALAKDLMTGYYVPIKHFGGHDEQGNELHIGLGEEGLDLIYEALVNANVVYVFNLIFDARFMEYHNFQEELVKRVEETKLSRHYLHNKKMDAIWSRFDMSKVNMYDTAIGIFNSDTNVKLMSLKKAEAFFLGWEGVETFETALGNVTNFYFLKPEDAVFYAGTDALGTFRLARKTIPYTKECGMAGRLDIRFQYILMKCEEQSTLIDVEWMDKLRGLNSRRLLEVEREIFEIAGRHFNPASTKELYKVLDSLGIHTGKYTKTGAMATGKEAMQDTLLGLREGTVQHRLVSLLLERSPLKKADTSYISPILKYAANSGGRMRFKYHPFRVPTGRLACGTDGKSNYFNKINIQAVTKAKVTDMYARVAVEESIPENVVNGYEFGYKKFDNTETQWIVEGSKEAGNIRKAFIADPGFTWVSVDFATQELRAAANFSNEMAWKKAFINGDDLHKSTAITVWGQENYDGNKRKLAKAANFGLVYGMSAYTFQARYKMDLDEAENMVRDFKAKLPALFGWIGQQERRGEKFGEVTTYFGRKRRVKWYFDHKDYKWKSFGKRTTVNTAIQGTCGDLLKLVMIRLWENVFTKPEYEGDVFFRNTVHDEINFQVRTSRLEEITIEILKNMETTLPNWNVPFTCGLSLGSSFGSVYGFKFDLKSGKILEPEGSKIKVDSNGPDTNFVYNSVETKKDKADIEEMFFDEIVFSEE